MDQYYLNKFDWTEVVVSRGSQGYFDGLQTHPSVTLCHEADMLDYGEPNPFVAASPGDIALTHRHCRLVSDYVAGLAEVRGAAEEFVTCLRYRLRGRQVRANVQASEESDDAHRLLHALGELCGFVNKSTGFDEPELTWALQYASKVLRVVEQAPDDDEKTECDGDVQFYVSTTRPLLMSARVGDAWLERGTAVEDVYLPDYQRVSQLGAEWLLQLGREIRCGWAEAGPFYRALMVVSACGERFDVVFSEEEAQERYERLVTACVADREELKDYLAFISDLREASVLNAKTMRNAERLRGESLRPW